MAESEFNVKALNIVNANRMGDTPHMFMEIIVCYAERFDIIK